MTQEEFKKVQFKLKWFCLLSAIAVGVIVSIRSDIEGFGLIVGFVSYILIGNIACLVVFKGKIPASEKTFDESGYNKTAFNQVDQSGLNVLSASALAGKSYEGYHHHSETLNRIP